MTTAQQKAFEEYIRLHDLTIKHAHHTPDEQSVFNAGWKAAIERMSGEIARIAKEQERYWLKERDNLSKEFNTLGACSAEGNRIIP